MALPLPTTFFAELPIWLRGIFLGLALAAPVGPIGILCIRRTLSRGLALGLATGIGAAMADTVFAGIAAFGLTVVIDFLTTYGRELRVFGGLIMLIIAWRIWSDRSTAQIELGDHVPDEHPSAGQLATTATGGFAITFTNPITIFAILTLVATLGVTAGVPGEAHARYNAVTLVIGVLLGSLLWWCLLCGFTASFRSRFSAQTIRQINQVTAAILALFGIWILGYALGRLLPPSFFAYF